MGDLLHDMPGITSRAMFGGWGLYRQGVIFGIIADGELFFKVDDQSRPEYEKRGSGPFVYEARGKKRAAKTYWQVPAEIMDDRESLKEWIDTSCRTARSSLKKRTG